MTAQFTVYKKAGDQAMTRVSDRNTIVFQELITHDGAREFTVMPGRRQLQSSVAALELMLAWREQRQTGLQVSIAATSSVLWSKYILWYMTC